MTLKFQLSPRAKQDLETIFDYSLDRWGAALTLSYVDQMEERIRWLCDHPDVGLLRPEIADGVRGFPEGSHHIFYVRKDENIVVLGVAHQTSDPKFRPEDLQ